MSIEQATIDKIQTFLPYLDERQKRLYLASEMEAQKDVTMMEFAQAVGVHRNTLTAAKKELHSSQTTEERENGRVRRKGGGRKSITEKHPEIIKAIEQMVEPASYGNPENPLRWTTKSLRHIADELKKQGFTIGYDTVGKILRELGYSLQTNRKMKQVGKESPDRDAQFKHINSRAATYLEEGSPVISIDCKKKENIGNFYNGGEEWTPAKEPREVLDHDFPLPDLGKALPYGIYVIGTNEGFVNVGISKDTAQFAVNAIRCWWDQMGSKRYPNASRILITADGGGSNGSRCRLFKTELQKLANETKLEIEVCHFPPGCSKWNKIEHRLFSLISKNWRGQPLETLAAIVSLIGATKIGRDQTVQCLVDQTIYQTGIKVSDEEMKALNIDRYDFHGEWNYIIRPQKESQNEVTVTEEPTNG